MVFAAFTLDTLDDTSTNVEVPELTVRALQMTFKLSLAVFTSAYFDAVRSFTLEKFDGNVKIKAFAKMFFRLA